MDQFLSDITPFFYRKHISYVDVGAHVGTTYEAVRKAKLSVKEAHLIEPNPASFSKLKDKVAEIARGKTVTLYKLALSDAKGKIQMLADDTMTRVVGSEAGEEGFGKSDENLFETSVTTLDELASSFQRRHVSLLKVDVEGFEEHVLAGAAGLLKDEAIDVIYIEAGVDPANVQQCYYRKIEDTLAGYGYRIFRIYEQKNEWLDDSPTLRRVNIAFMSKRFAAENPYRLTKEIFEAKKQINDCETQIATLGQNLSATKEALKEAEKAQAAVKLQADTVERERVAEISRLQAEQEELAARLAQEENHHKALRKEHEELSQRLAKEEGSRHTLLKENEELCARFAQEEKRLAEANTAVAALTRDRNALVAYGDALEKRYRMLLSSTSWRVMGPFRLVARRMKSLWTGRPGGPNRMPKKPVLSASLSKGPNTLSSAQQSKKAPVSPPLDGQKERVSRPIVSVKPSLAESMTDKIAEAARRNLPGSIKDALKTTLSKVPEKDPLEMLLAAQPRNEDALKKEYRDKGLDKEPDTFVLYRIIGNDLYPRHKKGQSRENVQFLLENEPTLENCEKRWVVNRIVDPDEERAIISMLEEHGQPYLHIPFVAEEYRKIGWDFDAMPAPGFLASQEIQNLGPLQQDRVHTALYRLKNNYIMHNNGARNAALRDGRARAKWVLPWDGNGFVTAKAWHDIRQAVTARPHLKYFAVPMERVTDNALLLRDDFTPHPVEEPQLLFRRDAGEEFNEDFPYGRRPKVELFWRLGIPGPWDRWRDDPWEQKRREASPEARQFGVAGWVARMNSGAAALEQKDKASFKNRGRVRQQAIIAAIDHVDALVRQTTPDPDGLAFYTARSLDRLKHALREGSGDLLPLAKKIVEGAERALGEEAYSVIQKTSLAPSGDPQDYWHPAPYWWPDPKKKDGLPYIKKDGQRVKGTRMYEPDSAQYDRTRLQLMFDGTTALALGWYLTGREDFATHGARLVRTWFLDPATRMNPHLRYAQVRRGHNNDEGYESGIIEFKDLYYVLDAVRLLEKSGAFGAEDGEGLKAWLREYLSWLETSKQGRKEVVATNNHGTYFDLQTGAIAAYLGEKEKLRDIFLRTQSRITQQFTPEGVQPNEMKRSITQHYVFFNLQGWLNIFKLAGANGLPSGDWAKEPHLRVAEAFRWIVKHDMDNWPYEQIQPFDVDRLFPLAASAKSIGIIESEAPILTGDTPFGDGKPIFDPHDAVMPYWNMGHTPSLLLRVPARVKTRPLIVFPHRGAKAKLAPSGATVSMVELAKGLAARGENVAIVTFKDAQSVGDQYSGEYWPTKGPWADFMAGTTVRTYTLDVPYYGKDMPNNMDQEKLVRSFSNHWSRMIEKLEIGVFHTNDASTHSTTAFAIENSAANFVWHERGLFQHKRTIDLLARRADLILTISDFVRGLAPAEIGHRAKVIPNPVFAHCSLSQAAARSKLIKELNVPQDAVLIGMVANNNPRKDWPLFIEIAERLFTRQSAVWTRPVYFISFGGGTASLQEYIERKGEIRAGGGFIPYGYTNEIFEKMRGLDCVLQTAENEPLGRVVIEAIQLGTPVIATNSGGHSELLSDRQNELLFDPGSPDAAVEKIYAVAERNANISSATSYLQEKFLNVFDVQNHVSMIMRAYAEAGVYSTRTT